MATFTISFPDGGAIQRGIQMFDLSGTGAGPFMPFHGIIDTSGSQITPAKDATLVTLSGQVPATLGQHLMAASLSVTIASDQVLAVAGSAAVGSAPTNPPLSVSGVDGGGLKRHLLTDTTGALVQAQPASIATGIVSVGTSSTQIVAARAGRKAVVIIQEGTSGGTAAGTLVRIGTSGVTTGTGAPLFTPPGASLAIDGGAAVYGIVGSGTQNVSFMEIF